MSYQYNDTTNGQGIIQDFEDKADLGSGYISGDTTRLKDTARKAKKVMAELRYIAYNASSSWQYDDGNQVDLPVAKTELTSGAYKYALPPEALTVNQVSVASSDGTMYRIKPYDRTNTKEIDRSVTGQPTSYILLNGTVEIYPTPNYTVSEGFKVEFDREGLDFAYNDTTKVPGIAANFHYLVGLGLAIEWLSVKQPSSPSLPLYIKAYEEGKIKMAEFYSERFGDDSQPKLKARIENCE